MALTDVKIKQAAPREKQYRLADSGGVYLEVKPTGAKYWRLKYRFGGKEKVLALGVYPGITLKVARERREAAKKKLDAGIDPSAAKAAEKLTRQANAENTFEAVAREWHGKFSKELSDSHAERQLRRLEVHVFPKIGGRPVGSVEPPEVLGVLQRIEKTGHIETAHRVRSIIGQIMRYAVGTGRAQRDPTGDLRGIIPPAPVRHRAAVTKPDEVGAFLLAIHAYRGSPIVAAALKLAPLVFQRPGELRLAEWTEFDLDGATWEIPSGRMKRTKAGKLSGADHFVPLSTQAVGILRELHAWTGHGKHVFPSVRGDIRPLSDGTLAAAYRLMGIDSETATPHGWRATARTLAVEKLGFPVEIVEMQLAHDVRDVHGRAYNRTQWLDKRRELMQAWADYLDGLRAAKSA